MFDSHAVRRSKLVLRNNEGNERPESTGQHGVGNAHEDHGREGDEGLVGQEGKYGVGTQRGQSA